MITWQELCMRRTRVLRELIEEAGQLVGAMAERMPPNLEFLRARLTRVLSDALVEALFDAAILTDSMTIGISIPISGTVEMETFEASLGALVHAWEGLAEVEYTRAADVAGEPMAASVTVMLS